MEEKEFENITEPATLTKRQTVAKLGVGTVLLCLLLCCSLLSGFLGVLIGLKISDKSLSLDSIIASLKANNKDTLPSGQIAEACAKTVDSVVTVYGMYQENTVTSISSGVVVAKCEEDGGYYIATCCHCVDGFPILSVRTTKEQVWKAEKVGVDYHTDIALLKVYAPDMTVATPRESTPYLGETIIAHGNPVGGVGISTSFGIVSQVSANVTIGGVDQTLLKVDMALNHGNSGGGIFDMDGNLIGIASAKISESSGVMVEGVAYAIPTSILYDILSDLKTRGFVQNRPILGINLEAATEQNSPMVIKESLFSGDLKPGDIIQSITAQGLDNMKKDFDGNMSHAEAIAALKAFFANAEEGQTVILRVERNGIWRNIILTVHLSGESHSDI